MSANDGQISKLTNAVRVHLLGGFEIEVDRKPVSLPSDAQRLVAFLAIEGHPRSRVYVAGRLWSEGSQERSLGSLRSALWRVRRGEPYLVSVNSHTVSLLPSVGVDVRDVDEMAARLESTRAAGIDRELDYTMFKGEILPGWYDDWIVVERERVRQVCLHALESIAIRLLAMRSLAAAHEAAIAAVSLEPLRESARRVVIQIHITEGNYYEAVRHYQEFVILIREELGLQPSPLIEELIAPLRMAV